ncbi:MAG: helix-turn-helix transcriptional regulator, partial [Actinobacteria bacterium]|nr:helix-turn-helix transcriptional regulator [Actinomycetota bacterium]
AALRAVLWAAAQLRRGRPESAQAALSNAGSLADAAVAQALTLIRSSDADALSEVSPRIAGLGEAARIAGALGTGRMMGEVREFQSLTEKERLVLEDLRGGLNTRQIADKHFLSVNTVRTHVRSIGKKLSASGQAEMLRRAEELKLFSRQRGEAGRTAAGVS